MVVEKDFEDTDMDEDIEEDEGFDTENFNEDFTIKIAFKLGGFVDFLLWIIFFWNYLEGSISTCLNKW